MLHQNPTLCCGQSQNPIQTPRVPAYVSCGSIWSHINSLHSNAASTPCSFTQQVAGWVLCFIFLETASSQTTTYEEGKRPPEVSVKPQNTRAKTESQCSLSQWCQDMTAAPRHQANKDSLSPNRAALPAMKPFTILLAKISWSGLQIQKPQHCIQNASGLHSYTRPCQLP